MLLRRLARPLLAGIFISGGINALRDPHGHEKAARPVLDQLTRALPEANRPSHVDLVRLDAGVKIGAGSLLALGTAPRLAAAALSASLIPTTVAQHRFWELDDPDRRQAEQIHFLKNLGLLGGLMLAVADTEGKPSLFWRARHRRPRVTVPRVTVEPISDRIGSTVAAAGARAERASGSARKVTKKAAKQARKEISGRAARASRRAERKAASMRSRIGR